MTLVKKKKIGKVATIGERSNIMEGDLGQNSEMDHTLGDISRTSR